MKKNKLEDKSLIVVEDDNFLLEVILEKFKNASLKAKGFLSGTEALRFLEDYEVTPSLIWLDYYLKETNGLVFVRLLRRNPQWSNVPVLIVSGYSLDQQRKDLIKLGVIECLRKDQHDIKELVLKAKEI